MSQVHLQVSYISAAMRLGLHGRISISCKLFAEGRRHTRFSPRATSSARSSEVSTEPPCRHLAAVDRGGKIYGGSLAKLQFFRPFRNVQSSQPGTVAMKATVGEGHTALLAATINCADT